MKYYSEKRGSATLHSLREKRTHSESHVCLSALIVGPETRHNTLALKTEQKQVVLSSAQR